METALIIAIVLLTGFVLLAMFDGFYLHLIRYKLYAHQESRTEHIFHTIRAILFPLIVGFLYLGSNDLAFYVGMTLVLADIGVLGLDAYVEKDSRVFMGGLPRWEYILHLIVNGFHFSSIAVFIIIKVRLKSEGILLIHDLTDLPQYAIFRSIATQLISGGVLMGLVHLALLYPKPANYWQAIGARFKCC